MEKGTKNIWCFWEKIGCFQLRREQKKQQQGKSMMGLAWKLNFRKIESTEFEKDNVSRINIFKNIMVAVRSPFRMQSAYDVAVWPLSFHKSV